MEIEEITMSERGQKMFDDLLNEYGKHSPDGDPPEFKTSGHLGKIKRLVSEIEAGGDDEFVQGRMIMLRARIVTAANLCAPSDDLDAAADLAADPDTPRYAVIAAAADLVNDTMAADFGDSEATFDGSPAVLSRDDASLNSEKVGSARD